MGKFFCVLLILAGIFLAPAGGFGILFIVIGLIGWKIFD